MINDDANALPQHLYAPRMEALCESIHSLRRMQGTKPWSPMLLAEKYAAASGGERACIAFVLYVWNTNPNEWAPWNIPPFSLADFAILDDDNRAAVAAWFAEPFWP